MVISGLKTGKMKTNGVVSMASSSHSQLIPTRPTHHNQLNHRLRTQIVRETGKDARNDETASTTSRKRHSQNEPTFNSDNRRNVVPRRANYGGQRATSSSCEDGQTTEDFTKNRSILSWLVDSGVIRPGACLRYMDMACQIDLNKGMMTPNGLLCLHCYEVVTVYEFEKHAGSGLNDPFRNIFLAKSDISDPYQNIFNQPKVNLLACQEEAWKLQDNSALCSYLIIEDANESDEYDDTCGTCGDGGVLICCDGCPSTYHQSCMNIEVLPEGNWICPRCKCKFCKRFQNTSADRLYTCAQCERKFHRLCKLKYEAGLYCAYDFICCGETCARLFTQLKDHIGVNKMLSHGLSWSLNKRWDIKPNGITEETKKITCRSKLAVALKVLNECFEPIIDLRSGVNMMQSVVYNTGSDLNRLNYTGFYTAILERDDEIISVASIRVHGTRLAEMPFIGTRHRYRRQGMCDLLLGAIESELIYLNVQKLIIPSVEERVDKWKDRYGFKPIEEPLRQEMISMNLLTFPATVILEKNLIPPPPDPIPNEDVSHRPAPFDLNLLPPEGEDEYMP